MLRIIKCAFLAKTLLKDMSLFNKDANTPMKLTKYRCPHKKELIVCTARHTRNLKNKLLYCKLYSMNSISGHHTQLTQHKKKCA